MSQVKRENAFSLIELLIVIAILVVILLVVLRSFVNDLGRTHDAERKDDLKQIKLAFENYYNDHDTYPPAAFLNDCKGASLKPYLSEVPCDPVSGEPYLYFPALVNGSEIHGYRILSRLSSKTDPIIEQLGCQNGCGIPEEDWHSQENADYVYGIAEGVPLVLVDLSLPVPTSFSPTPSLTPSTTPTGELDCVNNLCYCCGGSDQDCNVYTEGFGECVQGPFSSKENCYAQTSCYP